MVVKITFTHQQFFKPGIFIQKVAQFSDVVKEGIVIFFIRELKCGLVTFEIVLQNVYHVVFTLR